MCIIGLTVFLGGLIAQAPALKEANDKTGVEPTTFANNTEIYDQIVNQATVSLFKIKHGLLVV